MNNKNNKWHEKESGIFTFCIIITILLMIPLMWNFYKNYRNKISEGTVVSKEFIPGRREVLYDGIVPPHKQYIDSKYKITISGEKNGKQVEYTLSVSEMEYDMYNIGDHYPKIEN